MSSLDLFFCVNFRNLILAYLKMSKKQKTSGNIRKSLRESLSTDVCVDMFRCFRVREVCLFMRISKWMRVCGLRSLKLERSVWCTNQAFFNQVIKVCPRINQIFWENKNKGLAAMVG